MGKREYKKPKVTFIFTPGYEDRFTLEILKIYDKRMQKVGEDTGFIPKGAQA